MAVPLALVAPVSLAAPASAGTRINGFQLNALTDNALTATGTSLDQLDGVRVETVELPAAVQ